MFLKRDGKELRLSDGETFLGRKYGGVLKEHSRKCSKLQVVINLSEEKGTATVIRHGLNPSRIIRGGKQQILVDDHPIDLQDGDQLEVLIGQHAIHVSIPNKPQPRIVESFRHVRWEWKENDEWKLFDKETSSILENAFINGKPNITLTHGFFQRDTYLIQFTPSDDMKQINNRTKYARCVRRLVYEASQQQPAPPPPQPSTQPPQISSPPQPDPTAPPITTDYHQVHMTASIPKKRKRESDSSESNSSDDYDQGLSNIKSQSPVSPIKAVTDSSTSTTNALQKLMKSSKTETTTITTLKPENSNDSQSVQSTGDTTSKFTPLNALQDYIKNPEKHKNEIIFQDKKVIVIRDSYPKAKVHYLIIPKEIIPNYSRLDPSSLSILRKMRQVGLQLIQQLNEQHKDSPPLTYHMGFHALPSMKQLHMHLISEDFDSPFLKTKKHWNSFTTKFFISVEDFIRMLEKNEKIEFDKKEYSELLKQPLKCPKTGRIFPNLPKLKEYLAARQTQRLEH